MTESRELGKQYTDGQSLNGNSKCDCSQLIKRNGFFPTINNSNNR